MALLLGIHGMIRIFALIDQTHEFGQNIARILPELTRLRLSLLSITVSHVVTHIARLSFTSGEVERSRRIEGITSHFMDRQPVLH